MLVLQPFDAGLGGDVDWAALGEVDALGVAGRGKRGEEDGGDGVGADRVVRQPLLPSPAAARRLAMTEWAARRPSWIGSVQNQMGGSGEQHLGALVHQA